MRRNDAARLLILLGVLIVADVVGVCLLRSAGGAPRPFQRATGGFGLSSCVTPAWSFFAVDPRAEGVCENELFPVPGLPCPNPVHGTGLADLPPLEPRSE